MLIQKMRKKWSCYCGAGEGKNLGSYRSQTSRYNERRSNMRYGSRKDGATGKHQELIQACPEYQKLWKAAQDSAEWKVSTAKEGR